MKMKKILSVAAVLAIAASLGVSASAAQVTGDEYTIKKNYTVTGNTAVNPADTLNFTVESATLVNGGVGAVANTSDVTIEAVNVAANAATADIKVKLKNYDKVGVYTYEIKETAGSVAGVDYRADSFYLVVTVVNGDNGLETYAIVRDSDNSTKIEGISNTYTAGSLKITESTEGNLGDDSKKFTSKVTLTAPEGKDVTGDITYTDAEGEHTATWTDGKIEVDVTIDESTTVTFGNLPKGTTYDVTEESQDGYTPNVEFKDVTPKVITASEEDEVAITNTKGTNVETGINLDNLPYALALAGVAVAGGSIVIRRRRVND